jgi:hypothetical protein
VFGELGLRLGGIEGCYSFDVGAQGYLGTRRGVRGAMRFQMDF